MVAMLPDNLSPDTLALHHEGLDELGQPIGRHPGGMTTEELQALGHTKAPLLTVIRENCIECAGSRSEVRRCAMAHCALWPYRMATNPFHTRGSQ